MSSICDHFAKHAAHSTAMSALRSFRATDLFRFNNINLDVWTETYSISFYLNYLSRWPDLCYSQQAANGNLMGYVLGNADGRGNDWHGHVTALTVAPEYRRLHLGKTMMDLLERISDQVYRGFFVDLYVRYSNHKAIRMYEGLGYSVYRRVREYYNSTGPGDVEDEDAYDMRKPLSRDTLRRSVRPNGKGIVVSVADLT